MSASFRLLKLPSDAFGSLCCLVMNDAMCVFTWVSRPIAGLLHTLPVDIETPFSPFNFNHICVCNSSAIHTFFANKTVVWECLTHLASLRQGQTDRESYPVTQRITKYYPEPVIVLPVPEDVTPDKNAFETVCCLLFGAMRVWRAVGRCTCKCRKTKTGGRRRGFVCKTNLQL